MSLGDPIQLIDGLSQSEYVFESDRPTSKVGSGGVAQEPSVGQDVSPATPCIDRFRHLSLVPPLPTVPGVTLPMKTTPATSSSLFDTFTSNKPLLYGGAAVLAYLLLFKGRQGRGVAGLGEHKGGKKKGRKFANGCECSCD